MRPPTLLGGGRLLWFERGPWVRSIVASFKKMLADVRAGRSTKIHLGPRSARSGKLPEAIWELESLTELTAYNVQALDPRIGNLRNLEFVALLDGSIASLPDSFGALQSLHTLILRGQALEAAPGTVSSLAALTNLDISDNPLTDADAVFEVASLQHHALNHMKLERLPEAWVRMPKLRTLALHFSRVEDMPQADDVALGELESVRAQHNRLTEFPASLLRAPKLREIDVSYNQISELPAELTQLERLTHLMVDENPMTRLPDFVGRIPRLWHLGAFGVTVPKQVRQTVARNKRKYAANTVD